MKYLLDTNMMIHLFQAKEPLNSNVQKRNPDQMAVSGFTEAEILFGVENSDLKNREQNRIARAIAMSAFTRIYHDESVSEAYGKIKTHLLKNKIYTPNNEIDIFIAATAVAKDLTLITNNTKDFDQIPNLKIQDWS
jgi:tRNA(fMet)-specific endonuclease VapC